MPKVKTLILDTNALIVKGDFINSAEIFVTVDDVIDEVKDKKTVEFVQNLPIQLEIRNPQPSSLEYIFKISRETGDYGTLSKADFKVLALAYEEAAAANCLKPPTKSSPVIHGSRTLSVNAQEKVDANQSVAEVSNATDEPLTSSPDLNSDVANASSPPEPPPRAEHKKPLSWAQAAASTHTKPAAQPQTVVAPIAHDNAKEEREEEVQEEGESHSSNDDVDMNDDEESESEEDDGCGEWITPETVKIAHANDKGYSLNDEFETIEVGLVTTDFPMQNVALHIGIALIGVEGKRIRNLKKWILRCHACYELVKDTTRQFCPACGSGDTLKRVTYSVDTDGKMNVYINPKKTLPVRGTKYHLPNPRWGKKNTNRTLVLREDQLFKCGRTNNRDSEDKDRQIAKVWDEEWQFAGGKSKPRPGHLQLAESHYNSRRFKPRKHRDRM